ncbi:MAG: DUF2271 domain-containing protein [Luteolibacter sp.]
MKTLTLLSALTVAVGTAHAAETFAFYHENVLGTSMELRVSADDARQAKLAEEKVLGEIDRLSPILSTWKADSEISRWQAAGTGMKISSDLFSVLQLCETWQFKSHGAFHASTGVAGQLWKQAEVPQILPTDAALAEVVREMKQPAWTLNSEELTGKCLAKPGTISVDGLAKGYIIDRAIEAARESAQVKGLMLNIGGDLRVSGEWTESVAIADAAHSEENAKPLTTVKLHRQALATSGGYRRGWKIGDTHYSHIIDPRTARPVDHIASASVIADDATTADALATALNVLQPAEGVALVESIPGASCLIVDRAGRQFHSVHWNAAGQAPVTVAAEGQPMELEVNLELNKPEAERYLRPYVAVWIEDADGYPVRTLCVWILKGEKGLRWLPDLKRWNRADKIRKMVNPTEILPTVSSATRNPGEYTLVWDGLDDQGQKLPAGEYVVFIEAAREKGTYQIMKHALNVGGEPFKATLEGNVEVKSASLDYRKKAEAN